MEQSGQPPFLPINRAECDALHIDTPDIIIVSGDAYVDHPSFAAALLGRVLVDAGFSVAVIPQPDQKNPDPLLNIGAPRLFYAISGGSVDSMVSNYTPAKKRRSDDAYSPGGRPVRPDRAVLVYTDLVHRLFPDVPIVIGGIEASLRRFAHYDYWSDRIRQSILADAPADILVYGMGELALCTIAQRLDAGEKIDNMRDIPGTVWKMSPKEFRETTIRDACEIPSFLSVKDNNKEFCRAHQKITENQNPHSEKILIQPHPKTIIVQNPPARPLTTQEMDRIYSLPFQRKEHPSYKLPIPALSPVRFSVISHRGCYGDCHFCAISMHQGKIIQSRSKESILNEIRTLQKDKAFTGTISDVGGPSANMYGDQCPLWMKQGTCQDQKCITCKSIIHDLSSYLDILDEAEGIPGVKHVFIGSGIRYDLIPRDPDSMAHLCVHISGHMKVAPEHIVPVVTDFMNKPSGEVFEQFRQVFEKTQKDKTHRQYLVPYLISGHPGCTIKDMVTMVEYLRDTRLYPEQVQDFTPTPLTTSTCMYATGLDPRSGKKVHIPHDKEKVMQRAILRWKEPENYEMVSEGLKLAGREELIGTGKECLIGTRKKKNRKY